MSVALYTSVHGKLVKLSLLPGSKIDSRLLQNGTRDAMAAVTMESGPPLLSAESFQFSPRSGRFEPHGDRVTLTLDNSADTNLILLASAKITDSRTGLKIPCVVVEQRVCEKYDTPASTVGDWAPFSGMYRVSVVFLLLTKRKVSCRVFFTLGYSLKRTKLFVRDGPTLCWEHEGNVYFTRTVGNTAANQTKVEVVKLDDDSWKPSNSLRWFGAMNGDAVAVGTEQSVIHECSTPEMLSDLGHRWIVMKLPVHNIGESNRPMAGANAPMPHEYSNIVNCLHVCQVGLISQSGRSFFGNSDCGMLPGSSLVLAATSQSQLVETCGAIVRRVCNITFNDACEIFIATVTGGEELIVVHSASGAVCAVWRKSFEVAREWASFHTVLTDDFLFSGSEQLLLLGGSADVPAKSFRLTDLGMCNWSSEDSENDQRGRLPVCADNLQSAVQALEAQIQTGMAALRSLESQCSLKAHIIQQSQDALYKMAERRPPLPSPVTSLTCLCDLSGEGDAEVTQDDNGNADKNAALRCLSAWQRVVGNQWIVGAELANQTDRRVFDVHISLIPASIPRASLHSSVSTCSFKAVVSSSTVATDRGEPAAKRLKPDRASGTAVLESTASTSVVGVAEVPGFAPEPAARCTVVLHWREAVGEDGLVARRCDCGTASLSASDVASGKLLVDPLDRTKSDSERQHDIRALDALQLATPLLLASHRSNLQGRVKRVLRDRMGFQDVAVHDGMMSAATGALGGSRVKVASRDGPGKVALTVWSWNRSDLLLICQRLYQLLPDDVTIKPLPPANQIWSSMGTTMATIDKELRHTASTLRQLLAAGALSTARGHHAKAAAGSGGGAGPPREDELKQVRGDFEGERGKWRNSDTALEVCAPREANILRQKLLDLRIDTDIDACNLASVYSVAK